LAKLVVITDLEPAELSLVLDKVLETSSCPLKGMSMSIGVGIVPMKDIPESLRQILEPFMDPSKRKKDKPG
jgi:hypothetical protein